MAKKGKESKTNAMRILEKNKIPFEVETYECDEKVVSNGSGKRYPESDRLYSGRLYGDWNEKTV